MPGSFVIGIRPASVFDAAGIARVQVEAWRDAYVGLLPNESLIAMSAEKSALRVMRIIVQLSDPNQFCVAEYGSRLIGFCHGGGLRRALGPPLRRRSGLAEVFTLYVDPNFQGLGIGTASSSGSQLGYGRKGILHSLCLCCRETVLRADFTRILGEASVNYNLA